MLFKELKDFIIIDTETTGLGQYSRLVEFAGIKFREGKPVESYNVLINPRMIMRDDVIKIHHITNEMVSHMPSINEVSQDIYNFIGDDVLVAHNAPFDMDVLNRRLLFGIKNGYVDTLPIFKETLNLRRYSLSNIKSYFSIEIEQTHRALDDVKMLYSCLMKINKPYNINIKRLNNIKGSCLASKIRQTACLSNKLDGCHCVITGTIKNYSRPEFWQFIVNHGGIVGSSVIKKTRYLITGEKCGCSKIKKAEMKISNGDNIEIICIDDFMEMLK